MSKEEQECAFTGTLQMLETNGHFKVADKFRAYKLSTESINRKLKEAETVIDQLKNELSFSKDEERNLKSQIFSAQNRLICMQETLKKFIIISEQQRQNEKISQKIDEKVDEIREKISETRQETQNLLSRASREVELLRKIDRLECALMEKDQEFDLIKIEIQDLKKEKEKAETEYQQKVKNLESEVEALVKREADCNEGLLFYKQQIEDCELQMANYKHQIEDYKQQIEDHEKKIEIYEKERKNFLDDFELPKSSATSSKSFTWADSTVTINAEERSPRISICKSQEKNLTKSEKSNSQTFYYSPFMRKPKLSELKKGKNCSFFGATKKLKPQLEFSKTSKVTPESSECGLKRRLFSTNCNHYTD